jgi:putative transposase
MPWDESNSTEQKRAFLQAVEAEEDSFAALCRRFNISRETGYDLIRRHETLGDEALEPQSRRPLHSPFAISGTIEQRILDARAMHPSWGARKLQAYLARRFKGAHVPSSSSIGEVLHRNGLTHPRPPRLHVPPFTQPLAHCVAPNDVWCTDFKGWFRTLDGARCNPLTITDAAIRMLFRCHHVAKCDVAHVQPIFEATFREFGLPFAIRSDNGPPFASVGIAGLSRLSIWWIRLGIWPERIEPGHPEQNGRHERMHGTVQLELANHPEPNLRLQQRAFDRFRTEFNNVRPHEALGQRPPADLYVPSPRPFPSRLPELQYPSEALVRTVRATGEIKHRSHLHFLGEALAGERVALWEVDGGWDVYFAMMRLAHLDAHTGRLIRYQPETPQVTRRRASNRDAASSPEAEHART